MRHPVPKPRNVSLHPRGVQDKTGRFEVLESHIRKRYVRAFPGGRAVQIASFSRLDIRQSEADLVNKRD
jgi:hypothetical protein